MRLPPMAVVVSERFASRLKTDYGLVHVVEQRPLGQHICTVLALHGSLASASWSDWEAIMEPLAERNVRVFSIDMPGFGCSEVCTPPPRGSVAWDYFNRMVTQGSSALYKNDPVAVVAELIKRLKLKKVVLAGECVLWNILPTLLICGLTSRVRAQLWRTRGL